MPKLRTQDLPLALATVTLALAAAFETRADDWPHWLGPRYDGISRETGWRKDWPPGGPPRLWEKKIGSGYSALPVAQGHLILFQREGDELVVESLEPLTGKPRWRFAYPTDYEDLYGYDNGPRCCPAIYDGRVYTLGPKGELHALELDTGKKLWSVAIKERYGLPPNFFGTGATPLVIDGRVYANLGGNQFIPDGVRDGMAFAFDAKTGEEIWKTRTDGGAYASPTLAEIDGVEHLFIFHRGGLSDLDPDGGKERWKYPWHARFRDSVNGATPLVAGDLLFFSATYGTGSVCLRVTKDGYEEVWKDDLTKRGRILDIHWTPPIHLDGHLYAFSGRNPPDAIFKCVELRTGDVKWEWRSPFYRGSLLHSDGCFIALGEYGDLALLELSPAGHREIARIEGLLKPYAWTVPTLADGLLYLRDLEKLICLDLRPAKAATKAPEGERPSAPTGKQ